MPVFFSLHSDIILSALCIGLLLAGVTCVSLSRENSISRPIPSWRYLGISLVILAFREWFGIIGISQQGMAAFYAIAAVMQALAVIPLLIAAKIESSDQSFRLRIIRLVSSLTLAVILGILIEPFFFYETYIESGRHFITTTLFFLVKTFCCFTAVFLAYCTFRNAAAPGRGVMSVLVLFCLYCFVMSICNPPGLPTSSFHRTVDTNYTMLFLYMFRIAVAFGLGVMMWNVYAKSVGVAGWIRWWPLFLTVFIVAVCFTFVYLSQRNYQRVVENNIVASTRNAANSIPFDVLARVAATPGSANDREIGEELFGRVRKQDFFIGYTGVHSDVDALAMNSFSGSVTPVIDIVAHPNGGLWALGARSIGDIWSEVRHRGSVLQDLYAPRLVPVLAAAPIFDADDSPTGAAVLTISAIDLALDLYLFKRPALLLLPLAFFILILLLAGHQRAWLSLHSTNRAEAMRLGILANDLAGILITRGDLIIDANNRVSEITGMKRSELVDHDVRTAFVTVGPGMTEQTVESLMISGSALFEISLRKPDGSLAHIMMFARKLSSDPDDKLIIWESIDISRIKEMEHKLRETRDYLQMIIDSLPVSVFTKDLDGHYQSVNQAFVHTLGLDSASDVVGKTIEDIKVPGWDEAKVHDEICVDMRGSTLVYDHAMTINGENRFFEVAKTLKWLGDGEDNCVIVGCMHDFTTRKKTEDAIKSERHFLVQLINTLPVIVCFIDRDRVIRLCDQEFCREAGADDPEDLIGRPYDEVAPFGPSDAAEDNRMLERGGGYSDKDFEMEKDGRRRNFILRRMVMSSSGGRVIGLVKAFWDTTALVAANRAAKNADRAKAAFLSNMSHELRTPMNGIVGMADLVIEHESTEPVQRLYAETIIKSAKTLQMVIDEVMDIATLDNDDKRFAIAEAPFPLLTLTEEATEIVSCIVGAWGIDLHLSYDFSLEALYTGDARRLRQILVQVLTHCSRLTADKRLRLRVEPQGGTGRVLFECSFQPNDEIGASDLEDMFKKMSREPGKSAQDDKRGTSLGIFNDRIGLPLAWHLIQAMGGSLEVVDGERRIDCKVSLPLKHTLSRAAATTAPDLDEMNSVIAVADVSLAAEVRNCLEYAKSPTSTVGDVASLRDVLRKCRERDETYNLLLMDLGFMPRQDLPGFLEELENDAALGKPDVALIITPKDVQDLPGLNGNTAKCLLLTPLCPSELWFKTERMLNERTTRQEASPRRRPTRITRMVQVPADVLLVEDNTVNQMVEMGILKKIGCNPVLAKNGAEAVEKIISGGVYDLILMDCMMPIMDGYEATGRIRMHEKTHPGAKRHTIVALTANTVAGDKEKCLASGMDDYITKPVTLEMMREALLKHCPDLITMIDQAETPLNYSGFDKSDRT